MVFVCDAFMRSCLESDSSIISAVAHYGVYYGRMNSHIGENAFFCCFRYDVADILCVTRCMVSRYVDEYISPQLRASVLLLLELLFIRDGSFCCSLLSSHDIDELIDVVCTSRIIIIIIANYIYIPFLNDLHNLKHENSKNIDTTDFYDYYYLLTFIFTKRVRTSANRLRYGTRLKLSPKYRNATTFSKLGSNSLV